MVNRELKILSAIAGITICLGFIAGTVFYKKRTIKNEALKKAHFPVLNFPEESILSQPFDSMITTPKGQEEIVLIEKDHPFDLNGVSHLPYENQEVTTDVFYLACEANPKEGWFRTTTYIKGAVVTLMGSTEGDRYDIVARIITQTIHILSKMVELDDEDKYKILHYISIGYDI